MGLDTVVGQGPKNDKASSSGTKNQHNIVFDLSNAISNAITYSSQVQSRSNENLPRANRILMC